MHLLTHYETLKDLPLASLCAKSRSGSDALECLRKLYTHAQESARHGIRLDGPWLRTDIAQLGIQAGLHRHSGRGAKEHQAHVNGVTYRFAHFKDNTVLAWKPGDRADVLIAPWAFSTECHPDRIRKQDIQMIMEAFLEAPSLAQAAEIPLNTPDAYPFFADTPRNDKEVTDNTQFCIDLAVWISHRSKTNEPVDVTLEGRLPLYDGSLSEPTIEYRLGSDPTDFWRQDEDPIVEQASRLLDGPSSPIPMCDQIYQNHFNSGLIDWVKFDPSANHISAHARIEAIQRMRPHFADLSAN